MVIITSEYLIIGYGYSGIISSKYTYLYLYTAIYEISSNEYFLDYFWDKIFNLIFKIIYDQCNENPILGIKGL